MTYVWECKRTFSTTAWRITYVWKCQRTYHVVEIERTLLPPPTPPPTPIISTRAWPLTGVDAKNQLQLHESGPCHTINPRSLDVYPSVSTPPSLPLIPESTMFGASCHILYYILQITYYILYTDYMLHITYYVLYLMYITYYILYYIYILFIIHYISCMIYYMSDLVYFQYIYM